MRINPFRRDKEPWEISPTIERHQRAMRGLAIGRAVVKAHANLPKIQQFHAQTEVIAKNPNIVDMRDLHPEVSDIPDIHLSSKMGNKAVLAYIDSLEQLQPSHVKIVEDVSDNVVPIHKDIG
jgi:hypothetical protein